MKQKIATTIVRLPGGRRALDEAIIRRQLAQISASGVFDLEFYRAQAGQSFSSNRAAIQHFLSHGAEQGLSPHPLINLDWAQRELTGRGALAHGVGADEACAALRRPSTPLVSPSPLFDMERYLAQRSEGPVPETTWDAVAEFLSTATDDTPLPSARGAHTWGGLRHHHLDYERAAARGQVVTWRGGTMLSTPDTGGGVDWIEQRETLAERTVGLTSLLIPTYEDWEMTQRAVEAVLADESVPTEVVIIDNGSRPAVSRTLWELFGAEPRCVLRREPSNRNFAGGSNIAFAESSGDRVVFLNNDTEARAGWLASLRAALDGRPDILGVQPRLLYPDGSLQAVGTVFWDERTLPWHLLAGHPEYDAPDGLHAGFSAITAAAMMLRPEHVVENRGFDELYKNGYEDVDLCLSLVKRHSGSFAVCHDARVTHHESKSTGRARFAIPNRELFLSRWRGALPVDAARFYAEVGFDIAAVMPGNSFGDALVRGSQPIVMARPDAAGLAPERWVIRAEEGSYEIPGSAALRVSLRDLGELIADAVRAAGGRAESVSCDHPRDREYLDTVAVFLTHLAPVTPQPGVLNVLVRSPEETLKGDRPAAPTAASRSIREYQDGACDLVIRLGELSLAEGEPDVAALAAAVYTAVSEARHGI
ncbi:hypothetical protein GCM10022198_10160 [Klugiella xanthotipulae]|uniref:GT2 family glycosyltransferase n=1 Tax=Klugiella xanthotipulae TaxID=244735 RepID=A0A543HYI3_9MICO|nr:glycosyltransferase [Klugiella xanthotipulae]TQM63414.1 GT2 family glycosyltransferase [Klugiella xanthotipulae]